MFTGFKFSLIKTPLITGVKIPDHHSEPSPSRGWCGPQRSEDTAPERHAYKYPMGVGKMTEGRLFHTKHALEFGREPEQGGSEHERVYRKITANAASTVYDGSPNLRAVRSMDNCPTHSLTACAWPTVRQFSTSPMPLSKCFLDPADRQISL